LVKSCNELFQGDKNPTDNDMREAIYMALVSNHPNEIKEIESTIDGWFKYWTKVLQSLVMNFKLFIHLIIID